MAIEAVEALQDWQQLFPDLAQERLQLQLWEQAATEAEAQAAAARRGFRTSRPRPHSQPVGHSQHTSEAHAAVDTSRKRRSSLCDNDDDDDEEDDADYDPEVHSDDEEEMHAASCDDQQRKNTSPSSRATFSGATQDGSCPCDEGAADEEVVHESGALRHGCEGRSDDWLCFCSHGYGDGGNQQPPVATAGIAADHKVSNSRDSDIITDYSSWRQNAHQYSWCR